MFGIFMEIQYMLSSCVRKWVFTIMFYDQKLRKRGNSIILRNFKKCGELFGMASRKYNGKQRSEIS